MSCLHGSAARIHEKPQISTTFFRSSGIGWDEDKGDGGVKKNVLTYPLYAKMVVAVSEGCGSYV